MEEADFCQDDQWRCVQELALGLRTVPELPEAMDRYRTLLPPLHSPELHHSKRKTVRVSANAFTAPLGGAYSSVFASRARSVTKAVGKIFAGRKVWRRTLQIINNGPYFRLSFLADFLSCNV
jgi:hypothetical protein